MAMGVERAAADLLDAAGGLAEAVRALADEERRRLLRGGEDVGEQPEGVGHVAAGDLAGLRVAAPDERDQLGLGLGKYDSKL